MKIFFTAFIRPDKENGEMSVQEAQLKVVPPIVPPKPGTFQYCCFLFASEQPTVAWIIIKPVIIIIMICCAVSSVVRTVEPVTDEDECLYLNDSCEYSFFCTIHLTFLSLLLLVLQTQTGLTRFFPWLLLTSVSKQWNRKKNTRRISQLFHHVRSSILSVHFKIHLLPAACLKSLLVSLEVEKKAPKTAPKTAIMPPIAAPRRLAPAMSTSSTNSSANSDPKIGTKTDPVKQSKSTSRPQLLFCSSGI